MNGKQPYWPETLLKCYVQPIAKRLSITKKIGWHTFRRTLARFRTTTILRPLNRSLFIAWLGSSDKRCPPSPPQGQTPFRERSGHLCDTGRLYHRRTALPLREARGFALVRIHPAELFSI